jgi:hypothetical protein
MGEYLFGYKYSVFDVFVLITMAYFFGAGVLTIYQAFVILIATALVSGILTSIFAKKS